MACFSFWGIPVKGRPHPALTVGALISSLSSIRRHPAKNNGSVRSKSGLAKHKQKRHPRLHRCFLSITAGRTGGSSGWRNAAPSLHRQRKAFLQAAAKRDRAAPSPAPRGCRPDWRNNRGIRSRRCRTRRHPHSPHTCTLPSVARDGHQGGIRPPARQAHG